jgi:hypothetical protein
VPLYLGQAQGFLNEIGLAILAFADSLIFYLLLAIVVASMCLRSRAKRGRWPSRDEAIKAALGLSALATTIPILCIFLLTEPPAMASLTRETRWVIGLFASILFIYEGIPAILSSLFKKP